MQFDLINIFSNNKISFILYVIIQYEHSTIILNFNVFNISSSSFLLMNVFQLKWNKVRNHRVFYQLLKGFLKIISNFGTNYKRKLLAS